jgi:hypothetical protein
MLAARITQLVTCVLVILPAMVGCAARNTYRLDAAPVVMDSRFATIHNFGTAEIDPANVDALVKEVADILGVTLQDSVRRVRIVVTAPDQIMGLALTINSTPSGNVSAMGSGRYVEALYLPKASVALIPYFDRSILGHELAHYVTDHYLKHAPLTEWEAIADRVERKLWATKPAEPAVLSVVTISAAGREANLVGEGPPHESTAWRDTDRVALETASPDESSLRMSAPMAEQHLDALGTASSPEFEAAQNHVLDDGWAPQP